MTSEYGSDARASMGECTASVEVRRAAKKQARIGCYAPVFGPRSGLVCLIQAIIAAAVLLVLYFLWILFFGSPAILCRIRQLQFRVKHCRAGNSDPGIDLFADAYTMRVRAFRALYGKDAAWEQWMEDNRDRYLPVFNAATAAPRPLTLGFRYEAAPIAYNPPWANESEHMAALETLLELAFAGYDFQVIFGAAPPTTYGRITAGIATNASYASGREVFLYYESILNHEFAHVLAVRHHYDSLSTVGDGEHMPPGELGCVMDRNSYQFCSACRTALGIPLDVDNAAAIAAANTAIHGRYPY